MNLEAGSLMPWGKMVLSHGCIGCTQAAPDFAAEEAAAAAPELLEHADVDFKLGESASTRVESVSTQSPVDDFNALLQQGQTDDAVEGLQKAVHILVDTSLGDR